MAAAKHVPAERWHRKEIEEQHAELLAALKEAMGEFWPRLDGCSDPKCSICQETKRITKAARAAIARAEGRAQ